MKNEKTSSELKNLLFSITRCPNITLHFLEEKSTPCRKIINSQGVNKRSNFQVPEPWNGVIDKAPVLFVSSNPSIADQEQYPLWNSSRDQVNDFFTHRFGGGKKLWVKKGKYALTKNGTYQRATPYWAEIQNRASELLGREAVPGIDYAISEIVHCKSKNNIGVDEALQECAQRYLLKVLEISNAKIITFVGRKAEQYIKDSIDIEDNRNIVGPAVYYGKERLILFLPAPGSNKPRKFEKLFSKQELNLVISRIRDN
jgi:hypothetical protein